MEARVCVITGYGTNSQIETARAAILAGAASADLAHFSQILSGERRIDDYNFLVFPGGFLDGDDLGAAQAAAVRWRFLKDREGVALLLSLIHINEPTTLGM
nr:phosphoribosylformylglycinamidine synthase subunit PurQ [Desulfovibrio sp.]